MALQFNQAFPVARAGNVVLLTGREASGVVPTASARTSSRTTCRHGLASKRCISASVRCCTNLVMVYVDDYKVNPRHDSADWELPGAVHGQQQRHEDITVGAAEADEGPLGPTRGQRN